MEFLPRTLGTRPRLACEVRAEGVVAARGEDSSATLAAVSRVLLAEGLTPQARMSGATAGASGDRASVVAAVRKALEAVALRSREVTLIVPDAAVRVLLLDFDSLPGKVAEALPVVRFRLKKLLPFDAEDAAVSYQVMSTSKSLVRVVAVAMPREVLEEYEAVVREAGFEPGAVLPSTLAALAGLVENDGAVLVVNAGLQGVTTAIVRAGVLLLHRTVDLGADLRADSDAEARLGSAAMGFVTGGAGVAVLEPQVAEAGLAGLGAGASGSSAQDAALETGEVAQAVSVAAAYFEDTLDTAPAVLLTTGTMGAEALAALLADAGVGPVPVAEMVDAEMLGPGAASAGAAGRVPMGWLAGVRGALSD